MKIPYIELTTFEIPSLYVIPIVWFLWLWLFYFMYGRCECGAFYHTEEEKKSFMNFVWFSILSSIVIFAGVLVWI